MQLIQTVLILIQTYAACSSILRGPSSGTYSTGNNIKLTCITDKSDTIVWQNDKQTTIFVGDVRFETDEKYNNFFVNTTEGQSTLFITHVQVDDEGEYSCHVSNIDFAKAFVKIEDPPEVTMFIGRKETYGPLTSTIFITCRAEGARPKVSIRFQIEGHEWLTPTIQNTTMYNMLFDTIATVYFNSSDNLSGATVTCQSVGHEIIPHINETQTLYTPVCSFVTVKTDATCKCSAHPPVHKYVLNVDGVLLEGQNLTLKDHSGSTVSCLGVNVIGIGESDTIYIDSNGAPLIPLYIVFACIIVIIVLGTCIWVIRKVLGRRKSTFSVKNKVSEKNDVSEMEPLNNGTEQVEDKNRGHLYSIPNPFRQRALDEELNDIWYWICHMDGVRDDVELFLVEVLEVPPDVVQQAFLGDGSLEEKVRKILHSFFKSVTKEMLMERINTKNNICKKYRLQKASDIYRKVKVATQAVSGTKEEENNEPSSFDEMMKICGSLIGKVAVQRLFADQSSKMISNLKELYGEDDTQFMSGSAFVRRLNDLQLVKDNMDSIRDFMETIERVHQYRSCKCILHYIQKDQIKILVYKWIEQNPDKATKSSLEEDSVYMGKSLIARYCNSEVSDQGTAIGKFDSRVTICYKERLFKCGLLCGILGGSKLLGKYGYKFPNSNPEKAGSDALQILQKDKKITNECSSVDKLRQTLISINLFRAKQMVDGYFTDIRIEFEEYKIEVSATISSEWDLFAIDALGLEVDYVIQIINEKRLIKDQVSEVWRLWEEHNDRNNTKHKLIETIKTNSKDFASVLNLIDEDHSNSITRMISGLQQVDDSTAEDLPQQDHCIMNKLLSEFITICGGLFGIVGAKQMHRCYFPYEKALLREATQTPLSPGVEFLSHLIDNGKLFPSYHSFDFLASTLSACNLHRASFALRTCLTETGLFKYKEEWLTFASSSINQDWEIFGYEQLGLTENEMLDIIKATDDLQRQVRLAFEKWVEKSKFNKNVTSKKLIDVLSKSKPYDIHATNPGETYGNLLSSIIHGMECDWELFAIIDLKLEEHEVYNIITDENTVEDQIRSALELWSKKDSRNTYKTLLNIVLNSSVCKDTEHNSCWRKLSGDQGVNTGSAVDDQHIKDTNCERSQNPDDVFREMIQSVSVMIGNTGAFYLFQTYTYDCDQNEVKEKDDRFQKKEFDGEILIKYLIESGRLSDNAESLETFRIMLTRANLYRVRDKLDEYISQKQNKESNDDQFMDPNSSNV